MTKILNILFGDDELFASTISFFERNQVKRIQEALSDYKFNWEYELNPKRVIERTKSGNYNIVITDLDYGDLGDKSHKEGYLIIDEIYRLNPKPLIILCTSTKEDEEMRKRTENKADYIASLENGHKFNGLADILIKHFQEKLK